jgi:hypothetical protein
MKDKIVTIKGIKVKVVPYEEHEGGCQACAFVRGCPTIQEENEAGASDCVVGDHYYVEVADAKD